MYYIKNIQNKFDLNTYMSIQLMFSKHVHLQTLTEPGFHVGDFFIVLWFNSLDLI